MKSLSFLLVLCSLVACADRDASSKKEASAPSPTEVPFEKFLAAFPTVPVESINSRDIFATDLIARRGLLEDVGLSAERPLRSAEDLTRLMGKCPDRRFNSAPVRYKEIHFEQGDLGRLSRETRVEGRGEGARYNEQAALTDLRYRIGETAKRFTGLDQMNLQSTQCTLGDEVSCVSIRRANATTLTTLALLKHKDRIHAEPRCKRLDYRVSGSTSRLSEALWRERGRAIPVIVMRTVIDKRCGRDADDREGEVVGRLEVFKVFAKNVNRLGSRQSCRGDLIYEGSVDYDGDQPRAAMATRVVE